MDRERLSQCRECNDRDCTNTCEFARCVELGDAESLRTALQSCDWKSIRLEHGQSLLHFAAWRGKPDAVKVLIENGADIDLLDDCNDSPLMLAIRSGHVEVVRLLLRHGAEMSYSIQREQSEAERREIVRMRAEARQRLQSPEERAKLIRVLAIVEPALARPDEEFFRPPQVMEFHAIDECESFEVLKVLIDEFQASPNRVDDCGSCPLKRFVEANDQEAVRWLLAHGAVPDCTSNGETALFRAVWQGNSEIIQVLIEAGANVNQRNGDLLVPLHYARTADVARLLIKHGADSDLRDEFGNPSFVRAIEDMKAEDLALRVNF